MEVWVGIVGMSVHLDNFACITIDKQKCVRVILLLIWTAINFELSQI